MTDWYVWFLLIIAVVIFILTSYAVYQPDEMAGRSLQAD